MKIIFLLLFLPLFAGAQDKDSTFRLTAGFDVKKHILVIYFDYENRGYSVYDSLQKVGDVYEYKTVLTRPVVGSLIFIMAGGSESIRILMEPGHTILTARDSVSNFTLIGSKNQRDYAHLVRLLQPYVGMKYNLQIQKIRSQRADDSLSAEKIDQVIAALDTTMKKPAYLQFMKKHWRSPVSLIALREYAGSNFDPYEIEKILDGLGMDVKDSPEAKSWRKKIEFAKTTVIGAAAPDFAQPGLNGKQISLSSFRGKYVLLDFWASWCVPCRKENPHLVKAYKKYKKKSFEILSISLDDTTSKNDWIKAIKADGMTWFHASDLKGWDNEVSNLYLVESIPFNVLIDPEGKIVAKNLRGEDLERKLAELIR